MGQDRVMKPVDSAQVERSAVVVSGLYDESDEPAFWLSKTPCERLATTDIREQPWTLTLGLGNVSQMVYNCRWENTNGKNSTDSGPS